VSASTVRVDEGTDKYLHAWQRSVGGTAGVEQVQLEGQPAIHSFWVDWFWYTTSVNNNKQIFQLMGDGLHIIRIRALGWNRGDESTVQAGNEYDIIRATSAGEGGTALYPHSVEQGTDYGGDVRVFDADEQYYPAQSTAAGEGDILRTWWHDGRREDVLEAPDYPGAKPWIIGPSTSDGIVIKQISDIGSITGRLFVAFDMYGVT
jgi:hypothetical protein